MASYVDFDATHGWWEGPDGYGMCDRGIRRVLRFKKDARKIRVHVRKRKPKTGEWRKVQVCVPELEIHYGKRNNPLRFLDADDNVFDSSNAYEGTTTVELLQNLGITDRQVIYLKAEVIA